jgi:hypothetical protein
MEFQKKCEVCLTDFVTDNPLKRACSTECSFALRYQKVREWKQRKKEEKEKERKVCVQCGREYKPNIYTPHQKYCSLECRIKARLPKDTGYPREAQCAYCGKPIVVTQEHPHRKYCGVRCQHRANVNNYNRKNAKQRGVFAKKSRWNGNWFSALERDGYKCRLCGADDRRSLEVHHLDNRNWTADYKDANHDLDNLMTLCKTCHKKFHTIVYEMIDGKFYVSGLAIDFLKPKQIFIKEV